MKTAILTFAVKNDRYHKCADFLVESVKKHTDYDVYVYTDCPRRIKNRKEFHDIKEATDAPFHSVTVNVFNYHLKSLVFEYFYNNKTEYDKIVYLDADIFFYDNCTFIDEVTNDADFYFRNNSKYWHGHLVGQQKQKFEKLVEVLNLEKSFYDKGLRRGVETIFIANRSIRVRKFIKDWADISRIAIENNILAPYEYMELSIALEKNPEVKVETLTRRSIKNDNSLKILHKNTVTDLIYT